MTREFPGLHLPAAPVWRDAHDEHVVAADGRHYVDMAMGFGACIFGHTHPRELLERAERLPHALGDLHTSELRERALSRLCEWVEGNLHGARHFGQASAVLFQSGSEAVETALKTALLASGRSRIVSFQGSYHGTFGMALAVTHRQACRDPFPSALTGDTAVRFEPYGEIPSLDERDACVIVEPLQGRAGVVAPPDGFLEELRAACDAAGALLVVDAVLTGCGRTGLALDTGRCTPDLLCLGKALGGGVPASAVVAPTTLAERAWQGRGDEAIHTSTFMAHPFTCAAVEATLDRLDALDLPAAAGRYATAAQSVTAHTPLLARGRGALWAFDTGTPGGGVALSRSLLDDGFIVPPSGVNGECVTITPSLTAGDASIASFTAALTRLGQQLPRPHGGSAE